MNKKDKLDLALRDDMNRQKEKEVAIDTILNGPSIAEERVDHPFQYKEVKAGAEKEKVYELNVPARQALIIKSMANEWYPKTVFHLDIDRSTNRHERALADPEDPLDVNMLAREKVEWYVTNNSNEDRDIGILTDGFYIPVEVYENIKSSYEMMGGDIGSVDLISRD